jgi:hypothetical protein
MIVAETYHGLRAAVTLALGGLFGPSNGQDALFDSRKNRVKSAFSGSRAVDCSTAIP